VTHGFRVFSPRLADSFAFGPVVRQNIMAESMWWGKDASWWQGNKEKEGGTNFPIAFSRAHHQ
jgi:hypothetical protein